MSHTPGTWTPETRRASGVEIIDITAYDDGGKFICCPAMIVCDPNSDDPENQTDHDNARLIAAAPALLAACEAGLQLSGGWREAIAEIEDLCGDSVMFGHVVPRSAWRLKNMVAALDQLDGWRKQVHAALKAAQPKPTEEQHDRT